MKHNLYRLQMKDGSTKEIYGFSYYDAMVGHPDIDVWDIVSWKEIRR